VEYRSSSVIRVLTEYAAAFSQERWERSYGKLSADAQAYIDFNTPDIRPGDIMIIEENDEMLALLWDWQERVTGGTHKFPSSDSFQKGIL
jgi:hypothetical protein